MSLDINTILSTIQSHTQKTGYFTSVLLHEPKNAPSDATTAAFWVGLVRPVRTSGLNSVSALLVVNARLYANMLQEPQDAIDASLALAADALMTAYCGDFEFGGAVRNLDIFGANGVNFECVFGYLNQDSILFRTAEITLPLVINDVWTETA